MEARGHRCDMKVFVSGCFDLLHVGHVEFLETAAVAGELHVSVGRDATIHELKGRWPVYNERERLRLVRSLRCVHEAFLGSGSGHLDFAGDLRRINPEIFIVNSDGHTVAKQQLCLSLGIQYRVLDRSIEAGLPLRSTTEIIADSHIPYRIDLAGGWLDQPWVSSIVPGPVVVLPIEPCQQFFNRGGLASSTRNKAIHLWGPSLPFGSSEEIAQILFAVDNPPGIEFVSGSQDALGVVMPGVNKLNYSGKYWPDTIDSILDDSTLEWLEGLIRLLPLFPRSSDFSVLSNVDLRKSLVQALVSAADTVWDAIICGDPAMLGRAVTDGFWSQCRMFPNMVNREIHDMIDKFGTGALGYKISGAGGGGFLILVTESDVPGSIPVRIPRTERVRANI